MKATPKQPANSWLISNFDECHSGDGGPDHRRARARLLAGQDELLLQQQRLVAGRDGGVHQRLGPAEKDRLQAVAS